MIDRVTVTIVKGACDVAIGVIPIVHDENTRKRLARLAKLLQKLQDGSLSPEEFIEANRLHSKIHIHAMMTQNATILSYLEKGMLLLDVHKPKITEEQIDLIMLDEESEEQPRIESMIAPPSPKPLSTNSNVSIPEEGRFISYTEQMLLFATSISPNKPSAQSEAALPPYSSQSSTTASTPEAQDREDPIVEATAKATKSKKQKSLKKSARWSFGVGAASAVMLVPQVRRDLHNMMTTSQTIKDMYPEMKSANSSETSSTTRAFFSLGVVAALESKRQRRTAAVVSEC